jgi:hypothetical protein
MGAAKKIDLIAIDARPFQNAPLDGDDGIAHLKAIG